MAEPVLAFQLPEIDVLLEKKKEVKVSEMNSGPDRRPQRSTESRSHSFWSRKAQGGNYQELISGAAVHTYDVFELTPNMLSW